MDANKYLVIGIIVGIISSASSTYFLVNSQKNEEISILKNSYESELSNIESAKDFFQNENENLNSEIEELTQNLLLLQNSFKKLNTSFQENLTELESLRNGNDYNLHDPTYIEVLTFISEDQTDKISYDEETFNCQHFASIVNNNAQNIGIRCAFVLLNFYDTNAGHAIIGFNTLDRGMVYIEPQSDDFVEDLEIGKQYWTECVVPSGEYIYEDIENDNISEIIVSW